MRITKIVETSAPLRSSIANAVIDFSQMTVSVVAVFTDALSEGKPVVGFGFNSGGRYAQGGVLRERLIPRLNEADPDTLLDDAGVLDPERIHACMMKNEKPGGHGERAFAAGAIDAAVWDAVAKIEEKPLYRVFAERCNDGRFDEKVPVYPGGGYYDAEKGVKGLVDEMQGYRDGGYTLMKMKVGGAPLADDLKRIEAVLAVVGAGANLAVDANAGLTLETALAYADAIGPYNLAWFEEPVDPLDFAAYAEICGAFPGPIATGENLFSYIDAQNLLRHAGLRAERDWLQFDPSLCYGPTEFILLRADGIHPHRQNGAGFGLSGEAPRPPRRPAAGPAFGGGLAVGRHRNLSQGVPAVRRFRRRCRHRGRHRPPARGCGHRPRNQGRTLQQFPQAPARRLEPFRLILNRSDGHAARRPARRRAAALIPCRRLLTAK